MAKSSKQKPVAAKPSQAEGTPPKPKGPKAPKGPGKPKGAA